MDGQYAKGSIIKQQYGVSTTSLQRWANENKVRSLRTPGNIRLYHVEDVRCMFEGKGEISPRHRICYARSSSSNEELTKQRECLQRLYPETEIIAEIGSAINMQRQGLLEILDRVYKGIISEIIVLHKDRLCRFGFELLELFCKKSGTKIVVHSEANYVNENVEQELSEELFAIASSFTAKNNSAKASDKRRGNKYEDA